ncbi:hypothetical protein [Microbispora sp. H10836]|uniref:hypothetical protein n=1 Tax=Microbispora sp. H10836 TaxID=2729106 RepID=UPI001475C197|nr:hypothetical protein [Microbispora sp. H10836]
MLKRYADARGLVLPATIAPCPLPRAQQTKVLKRRDFRPPGLTVDGRNGRGTFGPARRSGPGV